VQEMAQWVEYLTVASGSPMADARRANGRAEAWRVPYWGVGNESWGCGGNMRPEYYADQYRRYATYCRNFGQNRLCKIACGANAADHHWTDVLMRDAGRHFDGLSLHYYTVPGTWAEKGSATQFDEADWFVTLKKALFMDELIGRHAEIMDRYDSEKRVGLIVDEWGAWYDVEPGTPPGFLYQQNSLRDALVAGVTLNIFNRHAGRVAMANIAQTVNVLQAPILTDGASLILTPTYHVFEMYRVHQGAAVLLAELETEAYEQGGDTIPALNLSASRDAQGRIHLTICNLEPERTLRLTCELNGANVSNVKGRILTAPRINDHNTAEEPAVVKPVAFDGAELTGNSLRLELPPKSVTAIELQ
jgi:alpha-N-arabinofuranosidase